MTWDCQVQDVGELSLINYVTSCSLKWLGQSSHASDAPSCPGDGAQTGLAQPEQGSNQLTCCRATAWAAFSPPTRGQTTGRLCFCKKSMCSAGITPPAHVLIFQIKMCSKEMKSMWVVRSLLWTCPGFRKRKSVLCFVLLSLDLEDKTSELTSTEKREQTKRLAYRIERKLHVLQWFQSDKSTLLCNSASHLTD